MNVLAASRGPDRQNQPSAHRETDRPLMAATASYCLARLIGRKTGDLSFGGIVVLLRGLELHAQLCDRGPKAVATQRGRLGELRVGEVLGLPDAGPVFLRPDLSVQIAGDRLELPDHQFQIVDLARLLVQFEALK